MLAAEPLSPAERYRLIHHVISCPKDEGGAAITPKYGEWKNVAAVFPLHDHAYNRKMLNDFSRKTFLSSDDLDRIRDSVGEKVG